MNLNRFNVPTRDMPRYRRLAKEGSWIIFGQIAMVLGSLVLVRVLTEHLDPVQYGQLALGLTAVGLMNQVVMGPISAGMGRFYSIAFEKHDLGGYLSESRRLMIYCTLAMLVIGFSLLGGLIIFGSTAWIGLTAAVLIYSVLCSYNGALSSIQNAARQRAVVAIHGGLDAWLKILLALCMLFWLGNSSTSVVIGFALSSLLITGSQSFILWRLNPSLIAKNRDVDQCWNRQILVYSWPMIAGGLFSWGYFSSQRWSLELFSSTSDVGQFYALTQIAYTPISMAGGMFLSFVTPILNARAGDATNTERLNKVHALILKISAVGIGLTIALAIASYYAHDFIFGLMVAKQYRIISHYMPCVVIAAGVFQVSLTLSSIITTANRTKSFMMLNIVGNLFFAGMNFYFTQQWGIVGLISSMTICSILHALWMILIIVRYAKEDRMDIYKWA